MPTKRTKKRAVYIMVYVMMFSLIGYGFFSLFSPESSCSDGKRNGNERGVDCGGSCTPCKESANPQKLIVREQAVVSGGNGKFDAVVRISNPNNQLGAKDLRYRMDLMDQSGRVIASRDGKGYILPSQTKYLAETGIIVENGAQVASMNIMIEDVDWLPLPDQNNPQITISGARNGKMSVGNGIQAEGLVRNDSQYDLAKIALVVVLRDEAGRIMAVGTSEKNSVRSKEERQFVLVWPYEFLGSASRIEAEADANIFDPAVFMQADFLKNTGSGQLYGR